MTAKTCGACQPSSVSSRCWHDRRCSVLRLMANSTRHLPSESRFLFLLSFAWNYARSPFGSHNRESEKRISFGLALLNGYLAEYLKSCAKRLYREYERDEEADLSEGWHWTTIGEISEMVCRGITPKYNDASDELILGQTCIRNNLVPVSYTHLRAHET